MVVKTLKPTTICKYNKSDRDFLATYTILYILLTHIKREQIPHNFMALLKTNLIAYKDMNFYLK